MLVSTKGRYALRIMIDLAEHQRDGYIPLKETAGRHGISVKYLEGIIKILVKDKMLTGVRGKGGGYKLNREPDEYRVGDILRLTEGNLAPVACLGEDASPCERASECRTLPMWKEFYRITNEFFDGITVADLMKKAPEPDYYI